MSTPQQHEATPTRTRAARTRRPALLATCVAVILTMTACAPRSDVTIEEYETESEQIAQRLLVTVADVDRYQDDLSTSDNRFVNAEGHDLEDHPWQYWQWEGAIELATDAEITPEEGADRMAEVLEDEGWTAREPRLSEGAGMYEYDLPAGEEGDAWYVALNFTRDEPPTPQNLSITIVSPSTDRTAADS